MSIQIKDVGMATPSKETMEYQVGASPVLKAMRGAMAGVEPRGKGAKALLAARSLYEREPREFMRLLGKLELAHDRKKFLKAQRVERRKREERAARRGYVEPVTAEVAGGANGSPPDEGPLPAVIAGLLGE